MKEIFDKLKHSPIHNYILPGLTSWVLKPAGDGHGMIRMFEASRETQEFITPHSHRETYYSWSAFSDNAVRSLAYTKCMSEVPPAVRADIRAE